MTERKAKAKWEGTLREGKGIIKFADYQGPYTYQSRFEEGKGINPEQLIAAAHSGCFTMALNSALEKAGFPADVVETEALMEPIASPRFTWSQLPRWRALARKNSHVLPKPQKSVARSRRHWLPCRVLLWMHSLVS
jgi:hypothetical protein